LTFKEEKVPDIKKEGVQISFKSRERTFPLPEAPIKVYEAPDVNGDPRLNLMDWGP